MAYKKLLDMNGVESTVTILRKADNTTIPFDESNTDYQEYLQFLADGGVPEPADE